MSEIEISSESEDYESDILYNMELFKLMINLCQNSKQFPQPYIEDMNKMYNKCNYKQKNSKLLCNLIFKGIKFISPENNDTFQYAASVYNELLRLSEKDSINLQTENCVASTSNGNASMITELENETSNNKISESDKIFKEVQDSRTSVTNKQMDEKTLKQLKKLKTALKIIRKKIKDLEEKEMDINNENEFNSDSAYILKDKYEKRIVEIYKRMCKLQEEPDFLEEPKLHFKGTNDHLVNKTIERYYNLTKTFPDYFEIHTLLQCLRDKKKLKWTEVDLKNISHDAFLQLGKQLKLRRLKEYFGRLANVNTIKDPAEENEELKRKLDESNKKLQSDLNALTLKFENKQDYAEQSERSDLNNTEYEYSSESDCTNHNKELKPIKPILVKQKRLSSLTSDNDKPPKKSQKTIYMESFYLAPSGVTPETIPNKIQEETTVITEKVPGQFTTINSDDNIVIKKIYSIHLGKDADYISKNADDFMSNGETCGDNKNAYNEITLIDVDDTTNKKNEITEVESEVNALNHKKYNWNKESKKSNPIPPPVVAKTLHQNSTNLNQNLSNNLVNHWVMNNNWPPKVNSTSNIPNFVHNNRQPTTYQGMRSTFFQNSVQISRQDTQRISNMVQQQRHFNNQSVLQE